MEYKSEGSASLIELLNQCESDLREVDGKKDIQQKRVLDMLRIRQEEQLLDLFELSSQHDYSLTNKFFCLLWSFKESADNFYIPVEEYQQAMKTIMHISQEIIDNWPSLTPKKVSRLGFILKGAANIASNR